MVNYNVKSLFRKEIEEASKQEVFQAVSYAIKDIIVDNWMQTQKEYEKQDSYEKDRKKAEKKTQCDKIEGLRAAIS